MLTLNEDQIKRLRPIDERIRQIEQESKKRAENVQKQVRALHRLMEKITKREI